MHGSNANQISPRAACEAATLDALQQYIRGRLGAGECIGAGDADLAFTEPRPLITGSDFQQIRARIAAQVMDCHAILAGHIQVRAGDIQRDIGRDVAGRIMHLVQKLFLHCAEINNAASVFRLGDQ